MGALLGSRSANPSPLRRYALVELGVGALGLVMLFAIPLLGGAYAEAGVDASEAHGALSGLVRILSEIDTGKPSRSVLKSGHYAAVLRLDDRTVLALLELAFVDDVEETVTSGRIFSICACARSAFFKSSTEEYGRLEMIFFTVTGPTPGRASSSCSKSLATIRWRT